MDSFEGKEHELIEGVNSVDMLLENNKGRRKIYGLFILKSRDRYLRIRQIQQKAAKKNIPVFFLSKEEFLKKLAINPLRSQGICAKVSNYSYCDINYFLESSSDKKNKLLILDGITDAGNFGGIIRSAFAFDFDGIIIPKHRSISVNKDVNRASSGTVEGIQIFKVLNLSRTLDMLRSYNYWIYGTSVDRVDDKKIKKLHETVFNFPLALILGSEHSGVSRLLMDKSDELINIEISKKADSLNVSVSAGILLHYISRQLKNCS